MRRGLVGFVDRTLQRFALADELAAHIDVGRDRAIAKPATRQPSTSVCGSCRMILAVLAGAGLRLVRIDHEVAWPIGLLRHEGPLETGRKTPAAAPPAQAGRLHLVDDPVAALGKMPCRVIQWPRAMAPSASVEPTVDVREDAVLVLEHRFLLTAASCRRRGCIPLRRLRERLGLLHPVLALDAAVEPEMIVDPSRSALFQPANLSVGVDAERNAGYPRSSDPHPR